MSSLEATVAATGGKNDRRFSLDSNSKSASSHAAASRRNSPAVKGSSPTNVDGPALVYEYEWDQPDFFSSTTHDNDVNDAAIARHLISSMNEMEQPISRCNSSICHEHEEHQRGEEPQRPCQQDPCDHEQSAIFELQPEETPTVAIGSPENGGGAFSPILGSPIAVGGEAQPENENNFMRIPIYNKTGTGVENEEIACYQNVVSSSSSSSSLSLSGHHRDRPFQKLHNMWGLFRGSKDESLDNSKSTSSTSSSTAKRKLSNSSLRDSSALGSKRQSSLDNNALSPPNNRNHFAYHHNLAAEIKKCVIIEITNGVHVITELTAADIVRSIRAHRWRGKYSSPSKGDSNDEGGGENMLQETPLVCGNRNVLESSTLLPSRNLGSAQSFSIAKKMSSGTVNGAVVVSELTYRDTRQILSSGNKLPTLEVRRDCILVCLPPVTALILHDRVALVVTQGAESPLSADYDSVIVKLKQLSLNFAHHRHQTFQYYKHLACCKRVEDASSSKFVSFPFEFSALEVLISVSFESLNNELLELEEVVGKIVERIQRRTPSSHDLERLHSVKAPIQNLQEHIQAIDKSFDTLISTPDDLRRMELTRHFYLPQLYALSDVELAQDPINGNINPNLEILLEFFDQELDQFSKRMRAINVRISNAESLVTLRLAVGRNQLIWLDLFITIIGIGIACGTAISGIFGMNLQNAHESSTTYFRAIVGVILGIAVLAIAVALVLYHKLSL